MDRDVKLSVRWCTINNAELTKYYVPRIRLRSSKFTFSGLSRCSKFQESIFFQFSRISMVGYKLCEIKPDWISELDWTYLDILISSRVSLLLRRGFKGIVWSTKALFCQQRKTNVWMKRTWSRYAKPTHFRVCYPLLSSTRLPVFEHFYTNKCCCIFYCYNVCIPLLLIHFAENQK